MQPFPAASVFDCEQEVEHICLSSEEPEGDPSSELTAPDDALDAELEQRNSRHRQRVQISRNGCLGVQTMTRSGARACWVKLDFLDPKPARPANRVLWALAACAALQAAALVIAVRHPAIATGFGWTAALALSLALAFLALGAAAYRSCNRLVYHTRHGRVPVLVLHRFQPDRRQAAQFRAVLESAIRRALAERPGLRRHLLRDEMIEHRRLFEEGVLGSDEFELAKARILRAHG
jgi:hypothetical protein